MIENAIRLVVTGGTFDKTYDELKGNFTFRDSYLPEIIKRVRTTIEVNLEINQLIDSLDMVGENRQKIGHTCQQAEEELILITHGTDTMPETAQYLASLNLSKTIVLTGAMIPYSVSGSDALFNLGSAFTALQLLNNGVYIAMNGRIFHWDNVRKNKEKGLFEILN
ncbi:asparaginase domain-containing protein [Spirochaeta cellobiosiphila]|uniref:asparaginase domain-containing protein n=1 Tax=Spirochaeta cellobiosiphila TaxID=504483 RepID=UPI00040016FA|nr:asparaginase domain-containing protein [Spirochaeta cellobiosiphila]